MTKAPRKRGGRGRPPVHDPSVIERLLSERERTGETYVDLETRSGIPAVTLSSWSRRLARKPTERTSFVELVVAENSWREETRGLFEIVVSSPHGPRYVVVPADFDSGELRRLLETLEAPC